MDGQEIKRMPADWINSAAIRGVSNDEVGNVQEIDTNDYIEPV